MQSVLMLTALITWNDVRPGAASHVVDCQRITNDVNSLSNELKATSRWGNFYQQSLQAYEIPVLGKHRVKPQ